MLDPGKEGRRSYTLLEILVVVALFAILVALIIPSVAGFVGKGEQEARATEMHNVQLVVKIMMIEAQTKELDGDYDEVQTLGEIRGVTAGRGAYNLAQYLNLLGNNGFLQAYDISRGGLVSVD